MPRFPWPNANPPQHAHDTLFSKELFNRVWHTIGATTNAGTIMLYLVRDTEITRCDHIITMLSCSRCLVTNRIMLLAVAGPQQLPHLSAPCLDLPRDLSVINPHRPWFLQPILDTPAESLHGAGLPCQCQCEIQQKCLCVCSDVQRVLLRCPGSVHAAPVQTRTPCF